MFKINGVIWHIFIVPPDHPELIKPNGRKAIGCCNSINHTIYISSTVNTNTLFVQVICHEVTHAVIASYGIALPEEEEEFLASFVTVFGPEIFKVVNQLIK